MTQPTPSDEAVAQALRLCGHPDHVIPLYVAGKDNLRDYILAHARTIDELRAVKAERDDLEARMQSATEHADVIIVTLRTELAEAVGLVKLLHNFAEPYDEYQTVIVCQAASFLAKQERG